MQGATTRKSTEAIQPLFDQIANSEVFRAAPVMRTLLIYLWEHQGKSLSEYAIAVDGLGRTPDFDPKADATVRVQVARLRAKLKEFYVGEEEAFALQLTIPLGGHELKWVHSLPESPVLSGAGFRRSSHLQWLAIGLGITTLLLAILGFSLLLENRALRASAPKAVPQLPRFWKSFLGGGRRTSIVLPSPVYFRWGVTVL
jgi:hypothetical protein